MFTPEAAKAWRQAMVRATEVAQLERIWRMPDPDMLSERYYTIDPEAEGTQVERYAWFCWDCEHAQQGFLTEAARDVDMDAHRTTCTG